jgi:hypothetical protein
MHLYSMAVSLSPNPDLFDKAIDPYRHASVNQIKHRNVFTVVVLSPLIAICLYGGDLTIRTYPDLSLHITGFLLGGCLYKQVGRPEVPTMVGPDEVGKGSRTTIYYYKLTLFRYADHICNPMKLLEKCR